MAKYTPSPWRVEVVTKDLSFVKSNDGFCIANVWHKKKDLEGSYNARLISKAPEMLKMLKNISETTEHFGELREIFQPEIEELIKSIEV